MTGDEFVFRLEHLQAHYAMPWAEGMRDFHRLTTGEAEEWYWLLIRTQNIAQWEELRQAINRRYGDGRPDHERLQEIVERRQRRGESLEAYFQALWRLRSKLHSPISEAWMVKVAKRNLEEPLRQIIFPMQVYTKDHLRDSCLETERVFGGEQKKYNMGYRQREREEMRPGRLAELVESPTREETANVSEAVEEVQIGTTSAPRQSLICWNCKRAGHVYMACEQEQRSLFCYKCGLDDTVTPKCPNCGTGNAKRGVANTGEPRPSTRPNPFRTKTRANDDARPYATVKVSKRRISGLLDSGASVSVLGKGCREVVESLGIPRLEATLAKCWAE
ncbi:uncharacterized protein LOC108597697 [Drosophila busckii]|uniref:uncharacterized protein LOC108597697 n=1 Tax=Drosophila busckii TaxID=30019 RepID=UPI00083F3DF2|nr:uncharacterized protein LOC108597697 [Drosophila busckii]